MDRDIDLIQSAQAHLSTSPYFPLRDLSYEYCDGTLVIRGQVPSYYLKQLAHAELVRKLQLESIDNRIEVHSPDQQQAPSAGQSSVLSRKWGRDRQLQGQP